jgi:hypothetical protein
VEFSPPQDVALLAFIPGQFVDGRGGVSSTVINTGRMSPDRLRLPSGWEPARNLPGEPSTSMPMIGRACHPDIAT